MEYVNDVQLRGPRPFDQASLRLDLVVEDQDVIYNRAQQILAEGLVVGVGKIGVAGVGVGKGHDESPIETMLLAFGTVVVAAGDLFDSGDFSLALKGHEAFQQCGSLRRGRCGLELEQDDVLDHYRLRRWIAVGDFTNDISGSPYRSIL